MTVHDVFVLSKEGKPLTPCTRSKARKLLRDGKAIKQWSKFNTFGIKLLDEATAITPVTVLGHDVGTKFEGFSVVCGNENNLNVMWKLPDKSSISRKLSERASCRRTRHHRGRRRECRYDNRGAKEFLAPSQRVILYSRKKCSKELLRIFPIQNVGLEDVKFNHSRYRWGRNFSTCEVGKNELRKFYQEDGRRLYEFAGYHTKELRAKYGYKKSSDKGKEAFESHCSDSLALACEVGSGLSIQPGDFIVINDSYRPTRRKLHYLQHSRGGVKQYYSKGTLFGIRKGKLVGANNNKVGMLSGHSIHGFVVQNASNKGFHSVKLKWVSKGFLGA